MIKVTFRAIVTSSRDEFTWHLWQVATPTVSKIAYYYEPGDYDLKKGWFPFRNNHFLVNSEKVRGTCWRAMFDRESRVSSVLVVIANKAHASKYFRSQNLLHRLHPPLS